MNHNNSTTTATPAQICARPAPMVVEAVRPATILVVDGRTGNIQNIRLVFGKLGYKIVPAANLQTAGELVSTRQPDLILLDLMFPGDNECDFCRQLKASSDWVGIPVIFLSAVDDKEVINRALAVGGADYITKPFSRAELISRVRTHLALKTSLDRLKELAQEKEELIGMLAHSLKNYLGGINLSADLVRGRSERLKDVNLRQMAEKMIDSSASALALVKSFLSRAAVDHRSIVTPGIVAAPVYKVSVSNKRPRKSARRKPGRDRADSQREAVASFAADPARESNMTQSTRISA